MENGLFERERVGVDDFVLLEDTESEEAFIDNLRKRFHQDIIYTYIGRVLVSVNPYKSLPIYDSETCQLYHGRNYVEVAPHLFALAEMAYQVLIKDNRDQCILISGESGAGKTESSRKILEFIATATCHDEKVETINSKLIGSNPVLEAFGNAKTKNNDNSSRFGKYMDIQFDSLGHPIGGNILNYLLEKSRIVNQSLDQRNFHIFYQLLAGASAATLEQLSLTRDIDSYNYLSNGGTGQGIPIDDVGQFNVVMKAMETMEISGSEQQDLIATVAAVLHLGNIEFTANDKTVKISDLSPVEAVAKLLECSEIELIAALTHRTIIADSDVVVTKLNEEQAYFARDALAKSLYDRVFTWLVARLNKSLQPEVHQKKKSKLMGILDIYGFEVIEKNSFEQFCINYCNEKQHQLFIKLVLKSEQEEYLRENITWEHVNFADNEIICKLIEEKHKGIISLMDEELLRPGKSTDLTLLEKLNSRLGDHKHYISYEKADSQTRKTMGRDEFRLIHYAGDVTYNIRGFLDKNNDLLYRDLCGVMFSSKNNIVKACFDKVELSDKKRPESTITQFKNSLNDLMEILMGKDPTYIRCIKPNDEKIPNDFNEELVLHQIKYLGLMENLRVRRAGFAYRKSYGQFLNRYKALCPETWPVYKGPAKDGVEILMNHLGWKPEDYAMGTTKLFIRSPKTLFNIEDAYQFKKNDLAAILQSKWKGILQRRKYLKMREAAIVCQKNMRKVLAIRKAKKRAEAIVKLKNFVKGYITRHDEPNNQNKAFIQLVKVNWLFKLADTIRGKETILNQIWPPCPASCKEASELLKKMQHANLCRKYRLSLSAADIEQFRLKVLAERIFRGRKRSYERSIGEMFVMNRLTEEQTKLATEAKIVQEGEVFEYGTTVIKYDRHGYKPRNTRAIILSNRALYVFDSVTSKLKHRLPYTSISFIVSKEPDDLLLIRIPPELKKDKGDLILQLPSLIEAVTKIIDIVKDEKIVDIIEDAKWSHKLFSGKDGTIEFRKGAIPRIERNRKSGNLDVIVPL